MSPVPTKIVMLVAMLVRLFQVELFLQGAVELRG
jgi:hypothetical protein